MANYYNQASSKGLNLNIVRERFDAQLFTALIRHTMMELIASHFTEEELKKRGLSAPYQSASKPGLLLAALRQAEKSLKNPFLHPEKAK